MKTLKDIKTLRRWDKIFNSDWEMRIVADKSVSWLIYIFTWLQCDLWSQKEINDSIYCCWWHLKE